MTKATLNLSPLLASVKAEAEQMGISFPVLLTADLMRYRTLAASAAPPLSDWERGLLSHALDGIEASRLLTGVDDLLSPVAIAAEIDTWADSAQDDDCLRAGELRKRVMTWSPLAIAGLLMELRP